MKYRALTVSREFGSGGEEIASLVARFLGWRLVDDELIGEFSRRAQVSMKDAAVLDEKVDRWSYRITRRILGKDGDDVSQITPVHPFDAAEAAFVTRLIIEEAYRTCNCVIVGRGAQCILQGKEDVYHIFIYGRLEARVHRVRGRVKPGTNVERLIRLADLERTEYVRFHYNRNRLDPSLYDLMIDSKDQSHKAARLIISAMRAVSPEMMTAAAL